MNESWLHRVVDTIVKGRSRQAQHFVDTYLADCGVRQRFARSGIELPLEPVGEGMAGGGPAVVPAGPS